MDLLALYGVKTTSIQSYLKVLFTTNSLLFTEFVNPIFQLYLVIKGRISHFQDQKNGRNVDFLCQIWVFLDKISISKKSLLKYLGKIMQTRSNLFRTLPRVRFKSYVFVFYKQTLLSIMRLRFASIFLAISRNIDVEIFDYVRRNLSSWNVIFKQSFRGWIYLPFIFPIILSDFSDFWETSFFHKKTLNLTKKKAPIFPLLGSYKFTSVS